MELTAKMQGGDHRSRSYSLQTSRPEENMPALLRRLGMSQWRLWLVWFCLSFAASTSLPADHLRALQKRADENSRAEWGRWGADRKKYSSWTSHSNRLIPIYTFGIDLRAYRGVYSPYRNQRKIQRLYDGMSPGSLNPAANYFDQTDVYRIQKRAVNSGKKYIILMVFDGMDWQTTQAAAIHAAQNVYTEGRGSGLSFQDYRRVTTDYGFFVTSPHNVGTQVDVNAQAVLNPGGTERGGYSARLGGATPWAVPGSDTYLLGKLRAVPHVVTDSASSATSMTSGKKTFNTAINVDPNGAHLIPLPRQLQAERDFSIGVVTSVPISHATPAAAYANNVSRNDYQDLTRDLIGLPSISHRRKALDGVDVLLGGGWGELVNGDEKQGSNFVRGNKFLTDADRKRIDLNNGGKYVVVQRERGQSGAATLLAAGREAYRKKARLVGFFGAGGGNLPFQTADGKYNPHKLAYDASDLSENPTLANMTRVALGVLSRNSQGFWLMIEAGDVDWANHANNLDNSIGAVLSGDAAFKTVTSWIEKNKAWDETVLILTADHGHYFVLNDPTILISPATGGTVDE